MDAISQTIFFKCIFLNKKGLDSDYRYNSLKFIPNSLINNIPALVQIMVWRLDGAKSLSEPMIRIASLGLNEWRIPSMVSPKARDRDSPQAKFATYNNNLTNMYLV